MNYPLPDNEAQRLAVLHSYALLDSEPEEAFERITRLAAQLLGVPVVLITLLDEKRQWFKSHYGWAATESPRDEAFCNYTILQDDVLVVPDASLDTRFFANRVVAGDPCIRFYAGYPLQMPEGYNLGALCAIDFKPRPWNEAQNAQLRDLTALVVNEIAVRRSEARFRKLVEQTQDIVTILAPDAQVFYQSPSLKSVLGWEPSGFIGERATDYIHPADLDTVFQTLSHLQEHTDLHSTIELRFRHRDGSWRWMESSATNNINDPAIGGILVTSRDISARKNVEEQLRSSEDRFKAVFEQSPIGMALTNLDGTFLLVNPALSNIVGYSTSELQGRKFQELTHPDDLAVDLLNWKRVMAGEISTAIREKRYLHQNGNIVWVSIHVTLLRDGEDQPQIFLAQIEDITERRRADEALKRNKHVAEQARIEAEQAREEAERANLAKSAFLSRVSHELRTPLNAILGFGQLLDMSTQLVERDRQSVGLILKGGRHLLDLINEILDISHIESGQLSLSPEPVSVREVCQEAVQLVRHNADERGITIDMRAVAASHIYVDADRQRLRQILLNLLSNAIKFNRERGHIAIRAEEFEVDQRVHIYVSDTGHGISPARQERLFRPFERLNDQDGSTDGAGIGLALSHRLVEAMGGTLGVSSEIGQGSTFWIEMPRCADPLNRLPQLDASPENEPVQPRDFVILYIEDNLANIRLMQGLLVKRPHIKLLTALQGEIGLEMAREQRPDLVLLDLHLPGISGLEVLDTLQNSEETHNIPVVIISADSSSRHERTIKLRGAAAYVHKPFNLVEFLRMVDEFVEHHT